MPKGEMRSRPTREDMERKVEHYKSLYDLARKKFSHDDAVSDAKGILSDLIYLAETPPEDWDESFKRIYAGWEPDDFKELIGLVRKRIPNLYREMN